MSLAIQLARENVTRQTGGPFGAAIFDKNDGSLVAVGVNSVVGQNASIAHAETVAIALAQQRLRTYDLAGLPDRRCSLYTSAQPCVMGFGIIWWGGIIRLVSEARPEDIETLVGFREGPLTDDWQSKLRDRIGLPKVEVEVDLLRQKACEVLRAYAESGQPVYNAGSGP